MFGCFRKAAAGAAVALVLPLAAAAQTHVVTHAVAGEFDDVRLDLETAIVNRGLVVDYEAFVGEMLARTAADVGAEREVFTRAESFQFCSAVLSRRMMEADPANLGFCPHIVFAYAVPGEDGMVHVGYRRLAEEAAASEESRAALAEINALMDGIVREAAGLD
jgi:uncharacterized protein (DUF302 family)